MLSVIFQIFQFPRKSKCSWISKLRFPYGTCPKSEVAAYLEISEWEQKLYTPCCACCEKLLCRHFWWKLKLLGLGGVCSAHVATIGWLACESMSECLVFYVVLLGFPGSELGNWISVFFLSLSILFPISVPYFQNELKLGCSRRKTHKQQQPLLRIGCCRTNQLVNQPVLLCCVWLFVPWYQPWSHRWLVEIQFSTQTVFAVNPGVNPGLVRHFLGQPVKLSLSL